MAQTVQSELTLQEFLALPTRKPYVELVEGKAVPKMSPQRFHSKMTRALSALLHDWSNGAGEVGIEWAVMLDRRGKDWVPIPDVLYISNDRLPMGDEEDGPCPVPPELVVEVVSPDQSFGEMAEKAVDYLRAGVLRVWIVDPQARSLTVLMLDSLPMTYRGEAVIHDEMLDGLAFSAQELFNKAGLRIRSE